MGDFLDRASLAWHELSAALYARVKGLTGRRAAHGSALDSNQQALSPGEIRRNNRGQAPAPLPTGLRRAFSDDPLASDDPAFVARAEATAAIGSAIEQWRAGAPTMLAITAPQGAGITSLMARIPALLAARETAAFHPLLARIRRPEDVIAVLADWFELKKQPDGPEALIAAVRVAEPRVILIDNGHYLVNRMEGLGAARVFGSVLVATQDRHLWVLGCRRHAFLRLVYLHQVDRFFTHRVELSYFTAEELAEVVGVRLERAGLPLSDGEATSGDAVSGLGSARTRELHQRSGGKPDAAFLCLLQACIPDAETGRWRVDSPRDMDVSALQGLERPELFTLAELIAHGNLSVEEHGDIFRVSRETTGLTLEYLNNLGLIDRIDASGDGGPVRYQVLRPIWALVARHLEAANYLY